MFFCSCGSASSSSVNEPCRLGGAEQGTVKGTGCLRSLSVAAKGLKNASRRRCCSGDNWTKISIHCIVLLQENKPTQAATLREWTRGQEKTEHVQCSHTGLYTAWVGNSSAVSVAVEENGLGWPVLISGSDSSLLRFVGR